MFPENPVILHEFPAAQIFLLPGCRILGITWKFRTDSGVIQRVYEELLTEMGTRDIRHIFVDTRRRGRALPEDEVWMMSYFVPGLLTRFGAGICFGYLLGEGHYREVQEESPNGSMESVGSLFSMKYFLQKHEAVAWLRGRTLHLA